MDSFWGYYNNYHKLGDWKQQGFILPQFWKWEVQNQGISRAIRSPKTTRKSFLAPFLFWWLVAFFGLFYFILKKKSYLLMPFTCLPICPLSLSLVIISLFSVFMSLFLFCLIYLSCFFYVTHMSETKWHLSFSDRFISLNIIHSRPIHDVTNCKILFFLMAE